MTLEELKQKLQALQDYKFDQEYAHIMADKLLLEYIGDQEVTDLYNAIDKWYG